VRGYLVKQTAASDLISAIREVHRGNAFFSPLIAGVLLKKRKTRSRETDQLVLSQREVEVLRMIARGKTNREMSERFFVSIKTVEKYRQQIMRKLNIHDVAGLTRYAITQRLVE
jgi:DNA-binding NarL/FixJ family response regulator